MSDIFISYSRKDSAQAEQLAERLRASGTLLLLPPGGFACNQNHTRPERLVCGCNANSAKLPARRAVTTPLGVARL